MLKMGHTCTFLATIFNKNWTLSTTLFVLLTLINTNCEKSFNLVRIKKVKN